MITILNDNYFRTPSGRTSPGLPDSANLGDTLKLQPATESEPPVTAGGINRTLKSLGLPVDT